MIRLPIPAAVRRRIGRSYWWLRDLVVLTPEVYARDIADDRPYACVNGHVIRYHQLSTAQYTQLSAGARMRCEEARCALQLFRTVVPEQATASEDGAA